MSGTKRPASPSSIRPASANKKQTAHIDDLREFAVDLQSTVRRMLPTNGRRYSSAVILSITFSVSDIPSVVPLRNELLDLLSKVYSWKTEKYVIDVNSSWQIATADLTTRISQFLGANMSRTNDGALICVYFSGHGFQGKQGDLSICGSYKNNAPRAPFISWGDISKELTRTLSPSTHRLVILDCCAAGLANLEHQDIEVLGASAWESTASASSQACFTRAIIDELKACKGDSVATTQLVSRLYSCSQVRNGLSMPVHKRPDNGQAPALIHRIQTSPPPAPPLRQSNTIPEHAHVVIAVKVKKDRSVPDAKAWAKWLTTNLPSYIGDIDIVAEWKSNSKVVVFVCPIEIWLDLPAKEAYLFMWYDFDWPREEARQRQKDLVARVPLQSKTEAESVRRNIRQGNEAGRRSLSPEPGRKSLSPAPEWTRGRMKSPEV